MKVAFDFNDFFFSAICEISVKNSFMRTERCYTKVFLKPFPLVRELANLFFIAIIVSEQTRLQKNKIFQFNFWNLNFKYKGFFFAYLSMEYHVHTYHIPSYNCCDNFAFFVLSYTYYYGQKKKKKKENYCITQRNKLYNSFTI